MIKYFSKESSFTLIELLITAAIFSFISVIAVINLASFRTHHFFDLDADMIVGAIRNAQNRSILGEGGYSWGIRFSRSGDTNLVEIFYSTYSSSTVVSSEKLRSSSEFRDPADGSYKIIQFNKLSGRPSSSDLIVLGRKGSSDLYIISVSSIGKITKIEENNLIGFWTFNEDSSTAYDLSGLGNNGIMYSSSTITNLTISSSTCPSGGRCISLDGVDDYVDISGFNLDANTTISFWIRGDSYGGKIPFSIKSDSSNGPDTYFGCSQINWNTGDGCNNPFANSSYPDSSWHMITVTNDLTNNVAKLYVDGEYIGNAGYKNTTATNKNVYIGRHTADGYNFPGQMDDVMIYDRVLNQSEILELYEAY